MSYEKTGGPAFPAKLGHWMEEGMTLRDYFAAQALTGLITGAVFDEDRIARLAYQMADAMLEVRGRENENPDG